MIKDAKRLYVGNSLPSASGYEEGDIFVDRSTGRLYIRHGGAWALSGSSDMLTSIQNDGSGIELVSDTGTNHIAKVRTLETNNDGIDISTNGSLVEFSFDPDAAGRGQPDGFPSLDGSAEVVERLSYEGVADGVATLDSATQVEQPPAASSMNGLSSTSAANAEFFINAGGTMSKATGGAANGPAILDANGKVINRLAYEGAADGVPTLDSNTKVEQRLAYEGVTSGVCLLDTDGMSIDSEGRKIVQVARSGDDYCTRWADGTQICGMKWSKELDANGWTGDGSDRLFVLPFSTVPMAHAMNYRSGWRILVAIPTLTTTKVRFSYYNWDSAVTAYLFAIFHGRWR